jgi:hypothetical protein
VIHLCEEKYPGKLELLGPHFLSEAPEITREDCENPMIHIPVVTIVTFVSVKGIFD